MYCYCSLRLWKAMGNRRSVEADVCSLYDAKEGTYLVLK